MFRKQKELLTRRKNLVKMDVAEIKRLIGFCDGQGRGKKRGFKNGAYIL